MDWLKHAALEYWPPSLLTALLAAILRWLRPRRVLSFIAAVKEREDMLAASEYWQQEAARREDRLTECREERDRQDQEITLLRAKLRGDGLT